LFHGQSFGSFGRAERDGLRGLAKLKTQLRIVVMRNGSAAALLIPGQEWHLFHFLHLASSFGEKRFLRITDHKCWRLDPSALAALQMPLICGPRLFTVFAIVAVTVTI
jgi:hypothetical protein